MTAQRTAIPLFTAVANIRRFLVFRAEFLLEVFAELEAGNATSGTFFCPLVLTSGTEIPAVLATIPVNTGIAPTAAVLNNEMVSDFF